MTTWSIDLFDPNGIIKIAYCFMVPIEYIERKIVLAILRKELYQLLSLVLIMPASLIAPQYCSRDGKEILYHIYYYRKQKKDRNVMTWARNDVLISLNSQNYQHARSTWILRLRLQCLFSMWTINSIIPFVHDLC